jgi:hypothetical protein
MTNSKPLQSSPLIWGAFIILLSPSGFADIECTDNSLRALDRFKLKIDTGNSSSAMELECQQRRKVEIRYQTKDLSYFKTNTVDKVFRDAISEEQVIFTGSMLEPASKTLPVAMFKTQQDKAKPQPIETLKGFESLTGER